MMNDDYVTQQMNQGVQNTAVQGIPEIVPQPVSELQQQMDAQAAQANEVSEPVVNPDGSHKVLLVVDDNKLNLRVASKILIDCGFDVDIVQSGFECLEKIKMNNRYDLIFMDIMMPQMDGVETMQKLKAIEGFTTPIIALTADAMEGSREKYLAAGFDEYLSKPIIKEIINELVHRYVDTGGTAPVSIEQMNAMVDAMPDQTVQQYAQPTAGYTQQAVYPQPEQPVQQQPQYTEQATTPQGGSTGFFGF